MIWVKWGLNVLRTIAHLRDREGDAEHVDGDDGTQHKPIEALGGVHRTDHHVGAVQGDQRRDVRREVEAHAAQHVVRLHPIASSYHFTWQASTSFVVIRSPQTTTVLMTSFELLHKRSITENEETSWEA